MQKFKDLIGEKSNLDLLKQNAPDTPLDLPPSYEESHRDSQNGQEHGQNAPENSQNAPEYNNSNQQGYSGYPDDKKQPPQGHPQDYQYSPQGNQYSPQGNQYSSQGNQFPQSQGYNGQQQANYDPMNDPNVYKVAPQRVNITQANPQHLNPQYQEYLARDQERIKEGDYPKGREWFKRGAPLNENRVNLKNKTGGSSFPGSGGATYHDAANR